MLKNNLHITVTEFRNESRVLKEATSISTLCGVDEVFIAALHADELRVEESISDQIILNRFALKTKRLSRGILSQILKYIELALRISFFYRNKQIVIVNIHSLSLLPIGYLLKIVYGSKLIYDTHELETETNGSYGIRKKLGKWVERLFIKKVDHIFVVSENIANWYADTYGIARPTVILNAPREQIVESNDYFRNKFGLNKDQVIVLYQGGLVAGRGVGLLLETFKKRKDNHVVIVFMGYGNLEKNIRDASKSHRNIFFHKAVSPNVLLNYTVTADVGVSFIENTCLSYYYCMPNKLFEYAMAGRPVIVSNMKEMREFVELHQMVVVVEEETIASINEAIDKLLYMDLSFLKQNAKKAALANAWDHQEKKMRAVYKTLLEAV